jgi:predicted esterase
MKKLGLIYFLYLLPSMIPATGCQGKPHTEAHLDSIQPKTKAILLHDTLLTVNDLECYIQIPKKGVLVKGDLLLLPGWDFSNRKWCDSTNVCETALKKGFRVIAPQMGRSVYATRYFPQTRQDFRAFPTLPKLDSALEMLKNQYGLFTEKNLVLGLSTGARGVALLCEHKPDWFHAAAALSGDYNQASMPNDNLMRLTYGPYELYKKTWIETDNPQTFANKMKTPIYLGHGLMDKVVSYRQTREFAAVLKGKTSSIDKVFLHIDTAAGHDFTYWRSELPAIWEFFGKYTN